MRTFIDVACKRYVVEVQADLRKAFDHVDRPELWAQAGSDGYPLPLLGLAMSAYAWPRRFEHDRASFELAPAKRGSVPGSAAATVELKLVTSAPLRDSLAKAIALFDGQGHITVHLAVRVDDIICSVVADAPRLALLTSAAFWGAAMCALLHGAEF